MDSFSKTDKYYKGVNRPMLAFKPLGAKRILDIGCGEGNFLSILKGSDDVELWGVEIDPKSAEIARTKIDKLFCGKIEDVMKDLPDNYFDVIFFNDVIEHLVDPWWVLTNIRAKLTNDGLLACSIPNVRYIRNLIQLTIYRDWQYVESGILDNTHLRFFTKKSIGQLFTSCGYTIKSIKGIDPIRSKGKLMLSLLINVFLAFRHWDIIYLQFAVTAQAINKK
jgi:2-polyprenyl-3-methyl-5-hydroxy-6-metoxy-1,4-benzoquinol methylase